MKELTLKETKFIKYYFVSGNGTKSARQAGFNGNDNVLGVIANRLLRKVKIKKAIEEIKKKSGLTDELLLSKHLELIHAQKIQSCNVYIYKDENGKWQVNEEKNEFIEVDDRYIQLGALKLAYEINGKLKQPLIDQSQHTNYVIFRNPKAVKEERENAGIIRTTERIKGTQLFPR